MTPFFFTEGELKDKENEKADTRQRLLQNIPTITVQKEARSQHD